MNSDIPLLLLSHGEKFSQHPIYSLTENEARTSTIPHLCGKRVVPSVYGWLVLFDDFDNKEDHCCLWNPKTTETIRLPRVQPEHFYITCVLSKPPTNPDCCILFLSHHHYLAFCQIGDEEFVTEPSLLSYLTTSIQDNTIYGLTHPNNNGDFQIATVDIHRDGVKMKPMFTMNVDRPMISRPWHRAYRTFFIGSPRSSGEFLLIHRVLQYWESTFRVFRIDVDRKEHEELDDIGNRVIFLSTKKGICMYSCRGIRPNSIYYTCPGSINLYVYDLSDRSTTLFLPVPAAAAESEHPGHFWEWI